MAKQFVYFYFMKDEPDKIKDQVPAHVAYWEKANLPNYSGGPFADRSGGLISFEAEDLVSAEKIIKGDPFVPANFIEKSWVKEWLKE